MKQTHSVACASANKPESKHTRTSTSTRKCDENKHALELKEIEKTSRRLVRGFLCRVCEYVCVCKYSLTGEHITKAKPSQTKPFHVQIGAKPKTNKTNNRR